MSAKNARIKGWQTTPVRVEFGVFGAVYDRAVEALDLPPRTGQETGFAMIGKFYDVCKAMAPKEWTTPADFSDSHMPWHKEPKFHAAIKQAHERLVSHVNFTWLLSCDAADKGGMPKLRGLMQRAKLTRPELPMYGRRSAT